ncbi:MAG: hypothetical protein IJ270_02160 [Paludibacteraceae bacterium]|nr:hypothetical protein [Paludibacteraceae bacterium]
MGYGLIRIKGRDAEMIAMGVLELEKIQNHY